MSKPVVLIAEELSPATIDALGPEFEVRHCDGANREELLAALSKGVDAVLIRSATKMDAEAIAAAKGPHVGWNRVEIRASRKSGKKIAKPFGQPTETIDDFVEAVAERYNTASELEVDIQPGINTFDFLVHSQ